MQQTVLTRNLGFGAQGGGSRPASPSIPQGMVAKYPQYSTFVNRLHSFTLGSGWPRDKPQKPEDIAMAGLYYAGMADCTRCFSCGGGLRNWLSGDIPVVEHARFFPNCEYILRLKGEEFVATVDLNYPKVYPDTSGDIQEDGPLSMQPGHVDYDQIVQSVVMKPCGQALNVLGFPPKLIRDAVIRVLSQNEWNESRVTSQLLANACFELQDIDKENESRDIDVPDMAIGSNPNPERRMSSGSVVEQSRDVIDGPPSPSECDVIDGPPSPSEPSIDSLDFERLRIREENRRLKESIKCKICLDRDVAVVYLPCGHLVTCTQCYSTQKRCPVCRTKIVANVRTYI